MNPLTWMTSPKVRFTLLLLTGSIACHSGWGSTFTVNNGNDAGAGSFRQAILDANAAAGPHTITFDAAHTVALVTDLPPITSDFVSIEGNNAVLDGNSADGTGIVVSGTDCIIAGLDFRGFAGTKVHLTGHDNVLRACLIGSTGARGGGGVLVEGTNNLVGGLAEGDGNIISGNALYGVRVEGGGGNQILGNRIGTNAAGTAAIPNNGSGILVYDAPSTVIGSSVTPFGGNLVSGNLEHGIVVAGQFPASAAGTSIVANLVGTDLTGTVALRNQGGWGIRVQNTDNVTVGGTGGARNVVCRATDYGISGLNADGLVVRGNYVGLGLGLGPDLLGLGNAREGVFLSNCAAALVEDNIVAGNDAYGIALVGTTGAIVRRNDVGVTPAGLPVRNFSGGIRLIGGTTGTLIGGYGTADGNVIAHNNGPGVLVNGATTNANAIARNSIHTNAGAGILLEDGGNAELAAPAITSLTPIAGTAPPGSVIEFFSDAEDEGRSYLGSVVANGAGEFSGGPDLLLEQGSNNLTATATNGDNNTSPFSAPVLIEGLCAEFTGDSPFQAIPDGGVIERTVTVSAGVTVADIDLSAAITHPAVEELIVRLQSPQGTWVTLSDATVSGSDLLITILDDQAAAAIGDGTAPYAGRFRPVSPLSVFAGQPAAGNWTLQVEDTLGNGVTGQLRGFSLCVNPVGAEGEGEGEGEPDLPCTSNPSSDVPAAWSAGGTVTSTITIPGPLFIEDLEVLLGIDCNSIDSLDVRLESPWGQERILFSELDNDGQDFSGRLDDEAPIEVFAGTHPYDENYRPQQALSIFDGYDAAGTWTLTISDLSAAPGTLQSWALCLAGNDTPVFAQCPEADGFAQPPDLQRDPGFGVISQLNTGTAWEQFAGLATPITAVTWWGYFASESLGSWSACDPPAGEAFYLALGPDNGPRSYAAYDVAPTVEPAGVFIDALGGMVELQRYTWTLPDPVPLESGRVDIVFYADQDCVFHWMTSAVGDGTATQISDVGRDLSLCLDAEVIPGEGEGEGEGEPDPPCTPYPSSDVPAPWIAGGSVTSTITIPGPLFIDDLEVLLGIDCNSINGLDVRLTAPWDEEVTLFSELDNDGQDFSGRLDDEAPIDVYAGMPPYDESYQPQQPFSVFDGADAAGVWTLTISDLGGTAGTLESWSLCVAGQSEDTALACAEEDGFGQPPDTRSGPGYGAIATLNSPGGPREDFAALGAPITAVTWWGYFAEETGGIWTGCTPPSGAFFINVYSPEDGAVANYYPVQPEVEDTGAMIALPGGAATLQRFRWPLPEPLALAEGRVSVTFYQDTPCRFFWMSSPWGDGKSWADAALPRDMSLCLEAAWSPPDPDPPCATATAEDTPVNLVSSGAAESTLELPAGDLVIDADVTIDLECSSTSALDVRLRSPLGTEVVLASAFDADGANFDGTLLDDEARIAIDDGTPPFAGAYRPASPLSALDGQPAGGTWTLIVTDVGGGSAGAIAGWSLCLATESGADLDCPAESGASQPPFDTTGTWSAARANVNDTVFERFSSVANPITAVTWWGYFAKDDGGGVFSACDPGSPFYTITLLTPELDQAASLSGVPIVESTGQAVALNGVTVPVLRLWRAAPGVLLPSGALHIGVPSAGGCEFYWLGAGNGDGTHIVNDVSTPGDLSLCIVAPETGGPHTADQNGDGKISLSELLRVIQFYNSDNYGCEAGTEDGYAPNDLDQGCTPHASDYNPQDWDIALTELLRAIQFYNLGAYHPCPEGEDGYCAGT